MLNLLRFRRVADYAANPELAPPAAISGAAAFERYVAHTLPYLERSGGTLMFVGEGGPDRAEGRALGPRHAGAPEQRAILPGVG